MAEIKESANAELNISDIREGPDGLRPCDTENESFQGLVESIRLRGFLSTITVRPMVDEDGNNYYEILDGLQRFHACKLAGLKTIRCIVVNDFDNSDKTLWQIMANAHSVPTKPVEYTKALKRLIDMHPTMTKSELSAKLGKSPAFIESRLNLLKLNEKVQKLVDEGEISLSNAQALSKLPDDEQELFIEQALNSPTAEFASAVNARCKEIADAKRAGKRAENKDFTHVAKLRTLVAIQKEVESGGGDILSQLGDENTTVQGAVLLALNWAICSDPASIAAQREAYEKMLAEREQARLERDEAKKAAQVAKAKAVLAEASA
jgi:ParB family chromosome partitioning protein